MFDLMPTKNIQLRGYQADAIEGLRSGIRAGKRRQILCAGTGAGKTVMAAHLLREADRKGSYALFLVDRVALVNQTSETFHQYGIPHGVVQGINEQWSPYENVQVCSVQTLARRRLPRTPLLIVWDECHSQYKATRDYINQHREAVVIGLTATPFTKGMGAVWDDVVNVIPTRELIEGGHLVEPTIFVGVSPDDEEFGMKSNGEFSDKSAEMAGIRIVGDVVSEWIAKTYEHFGGPVKTIVFSPTVEHGRELCAAFAAAGYNFQQVSYLDRDDDERAAKITEFRKVDSAIHGLVSCGVLTKGFDVPDVRIGISCKPYRKSLSSHMQEIGRVMRSHPGKDKALWLDHCGNIERFGIEMFDVWQNGPGPLDTSTKRDVKPRERDTESVREQIVCAECGGALRASTCTACGWVKPARSQINAVAGELKEIDLSAMKMHPRDGLRAQCLNDPRVVWEAALAYTHSTTSKGPDYARRWAYALWKSIYPKADKLPRGWYDAPVSAYFDLSAFGLIEREVKRFRQRNRRAA